MQMIPLKLCDDTGAYLGVLFVPPHVSEAMQSGRRRVECFRYPRMFTVHESPHMVGAVTLRDIDTDEVSKEIGFAFLRAGP